MTLNVAQCRLITSNFLLITKRITFSLETFQRFTTGSRTSCELHRLSFADLLLGNIFSGFSQYIQQCDGMLVDTPKKIQNNFFFLLAFGKWVSTCLNLGYCELIVLTQHISWLDCTVVTAGIIFWHSVWFFAPTSDRPSSLNHHRLQI